MASGRRGLWHIEATKAAERDPTPAPGSSTWRTSFRLSNIPAMNAATDAGVMNCPMRTRRRGSNRCAASRRLASTAASSESAPLAQCRWRGFMLRRLS